MNTRKRQDQWKYDDHSGPDGSFTPLHRSRWCRPHLEHSYTHLPCCLVFPEVINHLHFVWGSHLCSSQSHLMSGGNSAHVTLSAIKTLEKRCWCYSLKARIHIKTEKQHEAPTTRNSNSTGVRVNPVLLVNSALEVLQWFPKNTI